MGKLIAPRYGPLIKAWVPSVATWFTAMGVTVVYFTDWKAVLKYVPYINGKFKKDE